MKKIAIVAAVASLVAGCAHVPQEKPPVQRALKAKHIEPCPCSPTANQVVQKRWFGGWRFFH